MSYLKTKFAKKAPSRSIELEALSDVYRGELWKSVYNPKPEELNFVQHIEKLQDYISEREGQLYLNDHGRSIAMLCWVVKTSEFKKKFLQYLTDKNWKEDLGKIRNQAYHLLCWAYVASDLMSSLMKRMQKGEFVPVSTWHICAYCDSKSLRSDGRAKPGCHCYGSTNENGMLYINHAGGHKEKKLKFDCKDYEPPKEEVCIEKDLISEVRRIETLEEALEELKNQPIGADLINYQVLEELPRKHIYYGPKHSFSMFMGYHSVIIVGVMELEGEFGKELVAVCRLSNGEKIGDGGYIYVSLATLYTPIGVDEEGRSCVYNSTKPMHLLSNFVVPVYKEKGEREGGKEGEREGEKKDEAEEEKKEDDRDQSDQPKPKRQHLSRPSSTTSKSNPRSKKTHKVNPIQSNSSGSEYKEIDLPDTNLSSDFIRKAQKARKSKKASKNVELSRSPEVRSSVQTMKKNKDSVTNSTKQAYKSSEGKKCKSGTEGRSQKRQRVT